MAAIAPASATLRSVRFLAIIAAVFLPLNIIAYRALVAIHPRRRPIVIALTILGNAMWPFFPLLNARTDLSRLIRATLGPPWFAWQCFTFLYCAFLLLVFITRIPFKGPLPSVIASLLEPRSRHGSANATMWSPIFVPVSASSAITRLYGVLKKTVPSAMTGVASKA